jgi:hypothetical protein
MPIFRRTKGDLVVKVRVFPATVTPRFRPVEALSTEDMALEGWVYRQRDELKQILGEFSRPPLTATEVADKFNLGGWRSVAKLVLDYVEARGRWSIKFEEVEQLPDLGQCQKYVNTVNGATTSNSFVIRIRSEFTSDPFAVAAILAHELCHIIEDKKLSRRALNAVPLKGRELMEMERKVDLLVFFHQLGEFQMRVARQSQKTFGYFNQEVFERIYRILHRV